METFLIRLLQFLLAISLLVLLHEGGHFFFAKLFKVRVNKFYLFFNPKFHIASTYDNWVRRLFKMKPRVVPTKEIEVVNEKGEKTTETVKEYVGTEYGIGWLPLGGYCAIDGMIDETNKTLAEETHPWEFRTKPAWQRLLIMVGGVLVNFLLALFIYAMVLFTWGDTYVPLQDMTQGMEFNQQAKSLGFQDGDIMLSTNKDELKKYDADLFRNIIKADTVNVLRNGQTEHIVMPKTEKHFLFFKWKSSDLSLIEMIQSEPKFVRQILPAQVDSVVPETPASAIGLQKGDMLMAVNGKQVNTYYQFTDEIARLSDVLATAKTAEDSLKTRQIELVYQRNGVADTVQTTLTEDLRLGFMPKIIYEPITKEYGFLQSFPAGISYGMNTLSGYVGDLKYVFTSEGAKSLGGFGAIGSLFPATWDWHGFWLMTAFLSIILAFMNILPIPALDGGHVLFLLYEMITRRKPSENFMIRAEYIGFGILIVLMVVANLNDILRWIGVM